MIISGNIYAGLATGGGGGGLTGAQNGLSVNGANAELGGNPLLHGTIIDTQGNTFQIVDGSHGGLELGPNFTGFFIDDLASPDHAADLLVVGTGNGALTAGFFMDALNGATIKSIDATDTAIGHGILVTENADHLGFTYLNDYSAVGFVTPRWLPDIGTILANFTQQKSRAIVNAVNSSRNLVTFATAPGNEMYRISVTTEILTGTGVLATSVSYTDLSGNPQSGILVDTKTGVGVSNNTKVLNILCQAATSILIDTVLTGTAQGSIGFSIELLA